MFGGRFFCSALVAVMLMASGCGGSDDEPAVSLEFEESPINDLLGIDIAMRSGDIVQLERTAEAGVVGCMKAEGFEYIPVDFAAQFDDGVAAEDPDSRAYAEQSGYGVSIRPEIDIVNPEDFIDPNDEIRAQLGTAELESYQLALYGDAPVEGEGIALEERTGCVAETYRRVYAARAQLGDVECFVAQFADELANLEDRFRSDPRFLELEAQWSTCMADAGYNFAVREEIFGELGDRMSEVDTIGLEPGEEPFAEVQEQIDAVADWERSVAVADWDCTQPVEGDMQALRYGYEALFLQENRDRLGS